MAWGSELWGQSEGLEGFHDDGRGAMSRYPGGVSLGANSASMTTKGTLGTSAGQSLRGLGRLTGWPSAPQETGSRASPADG